MIYTETDKEYKAEYLRGVVVPNKSRALLDKKVEKGNPQKVTFINLLEECSDCIWNLPDKGTFHAFGDQTVEFGEQGMYIWRAEAIFGDTEVWTGDNNESGPETTQGTVLLLRE